MIESGSPEIHDTSWPDLSANWDSDPDSVTASSPSESSLIPPPDTAQVSPHSILSQVEKIIETVPDESSQARKSLSFRAKKQVMDEVIQKIRGRVDARREAEMTRGGDSLPVQTSQIEDLGLLIKELTHQSIQKYLGSPESAGKSGSPIVVNFENNYNYYFGDGERERPRSIVDKREHRKPKHKKADDTDKRKRFAEETGKRPAREDELKAASEISEDTPQTIELSENSSKYNSNAYARPLEGKHRDDHFQSDPGTIGASHESRYYEQYHQYPPYYRYPYQEHPHLAYSNGNNQSDFIAILGVIILVLLTALVAILYKMVKNQNKKYKRRIKKKYQKAKERLKHGEYRRPSSESNSDLEDSGLSESSLESRSDRKSKYMRSSRSGRHSKSKRRSKKKPKNEGQSQLKREAVEELILQNLMRYSHSNKRHIKKVSIYFNNDNEGASDKLAITWPQHAELPEGIVRAQNNTSIMQKISGEERPIAIEYFPFSNDKGPDFPIRRSSSPKAMVDFLKSYQNSQSLKSKGTSVRSKKLSRYGADEPSLYLSEKKRTFAKKRNLRIREKLVGNIDTVRSQKVVDARELQRRRQKLLAPSNPQSRSLYFDKKARYGQFKNEFEIERLNEIERHFDQPKYRLYDNDPQEPVLGNEIQVSRRAEGEISGCDSHRPFQEIMSQNVSYKNERRDPFSDLKDHSIWESQEGLILVPKKNDTARKKSEVIQQTQPRRRLHQRTLSERNLSKVPNLKLNFKEDQDANLYAPVIKSSQKLFHSRVNDRYSNAANKEKTSSESPPLKLTQEKFPDTPVTKQGEPAQILGDKMEAGVTKNTPSNEAMFSNFRSSLMQKLQRRKEDKVGSGKGKTQVNFYDENLQVKKFMYENGKFQNLFEKLKTIGRGSFGKVFLAKHLLEYQDYAIKQIKLKLTPKGELLTNNFQKEIRAMAVLQNKNVVRFFTSWMEVEDSSRKLTSAGVSLRRHRLLPGDDSFRLSKRKNSLENREMDFGSSILSDSQNLEWANQRFNRAPVDAQSLQRASCNEASSQLSRFNKPHLKMESERSRRNEETESGRVFCGQDQNSEAKISESENESLSNSSEGYSQTQTSNSSSSSDNQRFTIDYHDSDRSNHDDLVITFDAPPPAKVVSKPNPFSKKGHTAPMTLDKSTNDKTDSNQHKHARKDLDQSGRLEQGPDPGLQIEFLENSESDPGLQLEFLENSVSDIATASQINQTRRSFKLMKSNHALGQSQDRLNREQSKSINLYIQMEYCANGSLSKFMKNNSQLNSGEIFLIFTEILNGLIYIHQKGFIHRDLKPGNIFISKNGIIKIGDFGLITYIEPDRLSDLEEQEEEQLDSDEPSPPRPTVRVVSTGTPYKGSPQLAKRTSLVSEQSTELRTKKTSPVLLAAREQKMVSPIPASKKRFNRSFNEKLKQSFICKRNTRGRSLLLSTKIGTPFYSAPECQTDSGYDYKADVYSLGIILLELFSKFTTMHERNVVFTDFKREGRVAQEFRKKYNEVSDLIELLCRSNPNDRPYASEVKESAEYKECIKQLS